jgi:hypothetical protein
MTYPQTTLTYTLVITHKTHENKNIHNWNKKLKRKQRIDESKEKKHKQCAYK